MHRPKFLISWTTLLLSFCILASASESASRSANPAANPSAVAERFRNEPIQPILVQTTENPQIIALGRRIFEDKRLSGDESISCLSCHPLDHGGVDGLVKSVGVNGKIAGTNTPTVYNSGLSSFKAGEEARAILKVS